MSASFSKLLNICQFTKVLVVFVISAFTLADLLRRTDKFDGFDPLDHFEAELVFNAQTQGRAMECSQRSVVHFIREQRQRVTSIQQRQAVVKLPAFSTFAE